MMSQIASPMSMKDKSLTSRPFEESIRSSVKRVKLE